MPSRSESSTPDVAANGGSPSVTHDVRLSIDGADHEVAVDARESLWETMVYRLGLTVANMGCDRAQCGACNIVIDGRATNSCALLSARLEGRDIETVAGLREGPGLAGLHPLQRAFWAEGTLQCGICTRGFIMTAHALLKSNPDPTNDEIKHALAGVICRCGEHGRVIEAVKRAAAELRDGPGDIPETFMPHTSEVLGERIPRIQGEGSVTELGNYVSLMTLPDMLFVRSLRSPYPRARVLSINTEEAEKVPGVHAILHVFNLPDQYREVVIEGPPDRHILNELLVQVGMPVAVVAAESEHICDDAIDLIEVEYEVLEPVLSPTDALTAPKQWDNELDGTIRTIIPPVIVGNPREVLENAPVRIHQVTGAPYHYHVPIEMRTALYHWEDENTLTTWQTTHEPFRIKTRLASWLGIPNENVRVMQTGFMGSSYGNTDHVVEEVVLPAILARMTRRPVRNMLTREESFLTSTHRGRTRAETTIGVDEEGMLQAVSFDVLYDHGANVGATESGGTPAARGGRYVFQILYDFPNQHYTGTEVFTNNLRSGSMRGVGRNFGLFALETALEKASYQLGMDPLELRLKNVNEVGATFDEGTGKAPGRPFANPGGQRKCLERVAELLKWHETWHAPRTREVRPGVWHGMAIVSAIDRGGGYLGAQASVDLPSTGQVVIHPDGHLEVLSGTADQGAGQRTLMAMIGAQTAGIPLDEVDIAPGVDTDINTDTGPSLSSLQTNLAGWGVLEACLDAKRQLLELAAPWLAEKHAVEVLPDDLDVRDGQIYVKHDQGLAVSVADVVDEPIFGKGDHDTTMHYEAVATGAHGIEIEVDTRIGQIDVVNYVAVHDVGKVLNRMALEQQVEGGIIYGLGTTLWEELITDEFTGLPVNPNILDYKPPSFLDAPPMQVDFVEMPQPFGPYGAVAIGQASTPPVGPVIANALYNALGIWIHEVPLTRKKILAALASEDGR